MPPIKALVPFLSSSATPRRRTHSMDEYKYEKLEQGLGGPPAAVSAGLSRSSSLASSSEADSSPSTTNTIIPPFHNNHARRRSSSASSGSSASLPFVPAPVGGLGRQRGRARTSHYSSRRRRILRLLIVLGALAALLVFSWHTSRQRAANVRSEGARREGRERLLSSSRIQAPFRLSARYITLNSTTSTSAATYYSDSIHGPASPISTLGEASLIDEALSISAQSQRYSRPKCELDVSRLLEYKSIVAQREHAGQEPGRVFIALILYNNEDVLPTFLQEIPRLVNLVGNRRAFVSVYENGSNDLTPHFLFLLARELSALQVEYEIIVKGPDEPHGFVRDEDSSSSSSSRTVIVDAGTRIPRLAKLRNKALQPLQSLSSLSDSSTGTGADAVVFLNDVFFCAADALELLYQREAQHAHSVCGVDYFADPWRRRILGMMEFYDTWVARTINGQAMSTLETLGRFAMLHAPSRARYLTNLPFQVFSCWNGMAVLSASAFLPPHDVHFRAIDASDYASESYLLNVDLWAAGLGRIMIAPRVKLAYSLDNYEYLQRERRRENQVRFDREREQGGPVGSLRDREHIDWINDPPEMVDFRPFNFGRPLFEEPTMHSWNETLEKQAS